MRFMRKARAAHRSMPRIGHPITEALMEIPLSECLGVCRE